MDPDIKDTKISAFSDRWGGGREIFIGNDSHGELKEILVKTLNNQ